MPGSSQRARGRSGTGSIGWSLLCSDGPVGRTFLADLPSTLFQLADAVPNPGCLLVGFLGDRLVQLLSQLDQLRLRLLGLREAPRRLAGVSGVAVNILQEGQQIFAKLLVVIGTAEPAGVAELDELDAADRAFPLVHSAGLFGFLTLRRFAAFAARRLLLGLVQVLVGALLAQVQFFVLIVGQDFRDMQGGRLRTLLALHRCGSTGLRPGQESPLSAILTVKEKVSSRAAWGPL